MTHEEYKSKSQMKRVEILKAGEKTMTHEELLAKINTDEYVNDGSGNAAALRAVVELHKPTLVDNCEPNWTICKECGAQCPKHTEYPCKTIQAIEERLK